MSKFQECLATFDKEFKKLGIKYDAKLLAAVAKGLGPSLYKNDASKVAASDKSELDRIKKNFLNTETFTRSSFTPTKKMMNDPASNCWTPSSTMPIH